MNNIHPRGGALRRLSCACCRRCPRAAADDAESARLIEELGLKESATALRDRSGWAPPKKVVADGRRRGATGLRCSPRRPASRWSPPPDRAAAVREAADADALIGECVAEVIEAGPRIRWVQRMYAGVERCVAIPAFAERGIVLTNMQKVAGSVMAEHVLAFMFGLTRGLAAYVPAQAKGEWADEAVPESRLWEVKGRTMLVVGLGGIGTEVAKRAHALGMTVIATRNSGTDGPEYVAEVGLPDKLLPFAARADVIVSTLPLTRADEGAHGQGLLRCRKARRTLHQRGPRRDRRHGRPGRGAHRTGGSAARASTSPIPSRCRRSIRCGARRT